MVPDAFLCLPNFGSFLGSCQRFIFVVGAVLKASPYPTLVRGTGTGAAVAVGRLGAIIGPFFAGQLLNLGASRGKVVESSS